MPPSDALSARQIEQFYGPEYFAAMESFYRGRRRWAKMRIDSMLALVQPRKEDIVCELASAAGQMSDLLAQFAGRVTGVDVAPAAVEAARQAFRRPNLEFVQADVRDLRAFGNGAFTKVAAIDLVEHLYEEDFRQMSREVHRLLKPGGTYSIFTPCPTHYIERLKRLGLLKPDPSHIDLKTPERISETLRLTGFEIDARWFEPIFLPGLHTLERGLQRIPGLGPLFRYRICIRGIRTA